MTRAGALLGLAGLAFATVLVAREGAGAVFSALASAGPGVLLASAIHVVPMTFNARAWALLVGRTRRRPITFFTWLVWVREAVNGLLPVARVGGEVAAARLMIQRGVRAPSAVASIVADMTISLGTQALFTVGGLVLLFGRDPSGALARSGALLLLSAALLVLLLAVAQRLGAFGAAGRVARRIIGDRVEGLARGGRRTDRALRAVYRGRLRVLGCAAWQLAGWVAGAAEIWAFLALIGARVSACDAIALEAMVQAASSAAFIIPGAIGVQEGAFAAVGQAIGLPPGVALALAIFRRARDVIAFVPALVLWQGNEGRHLFARE